MRWRDLKVNPVTSAAVRALLGACCRSVRSFIFVATTGRSGTKSLHRIPGSIPGSVALHEPYPTMMGSVLAAYNDGDDAVMRREFRLRKLPHVYRAATFKRWYVETNHGFIKGFGDAAAEHLAPKLQVVRLLRDPARVARSLLLRDTVPARTDRGREYLIDPAAPRNLVRMADRLADGAEFDHDYFRCLWYCYEIEARCRRFQSDHPDVPVHRVSTDDLNDSQKVGRLLTALGMPATPDLLQRVTGTRANVSPVRPPPPAEFPEDRATAFRSACEEALRRVP
jgi:hypothetical protein